MSELSNQGTNLWCGMPVHPGVAVRLLRESVEEPTNEVLLRKTLAMDPALSLSVFRQAMRSVSTSLDGASTYRGLVDRLTVPVCRFAAVRAIVNASNDEVPPRSMAARWRRACVRSSIARALAAVSQRVDPDMASVAALLYDAGGFLEADYWQARTIEVLEQHGTPESILLNIRDAFECPRGQRPIDAEVLAVADDASRSIYHADDEEAEIPTHVAPELRAGRWEHIVRDAVEDVDASMQVPDVSWSQIREDAVRVLTEMAGTAFEEVNTLRTRTRELSRQVATDALTGLYSRLAFTQRFEEEMERARRDGLPITLLLFDLDGFKAINDTYGHPAGDTYLTSTAGVLQSCARRIDVVARYGGEEFAVILPHTNLAGATAIAERLRRSIESLEVEHDGVTIKTTASIGACTVHSVERARMTTARLIELADRQLYLAKRSGKNRCELVQADDQIAAAG